ncbi:ParA family protein [Candidatus Frankia alpina]|uniref:ParA family protein n=1 Tax=Candidatus Frankia alpina TaxID=2699483 RepID=A0A4S5ETH0_9ACTN|nr:ParA family protein [Candidatus Frankia alpina]THJ75380.1 ParA family protein [Candidatus Frankia alpina]
MVSTVRITIGNLKGGVAKTTTAMHLAAGLPGRVLLVDADPQASTALDWSTSAGDAWPDRIVVVPWPQADLARRVRAVADDYDHLVIDTGGEDDSILAAALMVADELVIPVAPSPLDLRRLPATFALAARVDAVSPVSARVLLVKVRRNTASARDSRALLEDMGLPVMESSVSLWEQYIQAFGALPVDLGEYADVLAELAAPDDAEQVAG